MTDDQPDPEPQMAEAAGEEPARPGDTHPAVGSVGVGVPPAPSPSKSLNWYQKLALRILRVLGADPGAPPPSEVGRWPSTAQSLLWDLAPDEVAPSREGVVLPRWQEPSWLADLPDDQVEIARAATQAELNRSLDFVAAVELKASRLLTPFIALLAGAAALTIFHIAAVGTSPSGFLSLAGAVFGGAGIVFLLIGMVRALDADTRLGTSLRATIEQEVRDPRLALRSDLQGVAAARFVLRNKGGRILFARAAISRGLVMLLVSALLGAVGVALTRDDQQQGGDPGPISPASTPPTSRMSSTATPSANPSARATPTADIAPTISTAAATATSAASP